MKLLDLTQGRQAMVDDEDYQRLSAFIWQARANGTGRTYASRSTNAHGTVMLQREVMQCAHNEAVRFISENTLDCRRSNLVVFLRP